MDARYHERKAAYHEAGHAIIAIYNRFPVRHVTVDTMGGGETALAWWHQFAMRYSGERNVLRYIAYLFGGYAGEMLVRTEEDRHFGSAHDLGRAEHLRMCQMISRERFDLLRTRVHLFVRNRRRLVSFVAERLFREHELSGQELERIYREFERRYPHCARSALF